MGNTVGNLSANFCDFRSSKLDAYILGLWCADGYHRGGGVGLSNTDEELIRRFLDFFKIHFANSKIRLRVYTNDLVGRKYKQFGLRNISVCNSEKARKVAYHVYVNCISLLREISSKKYAKKQFKNKQVAWAYISGRFDGDGTIGKDLRRDIRISYTTRPEARMDLAIFRKLGFRKTKIYYYRTSNAYVIYVSRFESKKFVEGCYNFSAKLQKLALGSRRDSADLRISA